jgi:hypothetical protein
MASHRAQIAALFMTTVVAMPANADSLGMNGVDVNGEITLGFAQIDTPGGTQEQTYGAIALDGTITIADGFGLGFDLFAVEDFESSDRRDYGYAYLFYSLGRGEFRAGIVPSAVDLIMPEDSFTYGVLVESDLVAVAGSAVQFLALDEDELVPTGVSYVADYGALDFAASVHFARNSSNMIYALAGTYAIEDNPGGLSAYVSGGLEHVDSSTDSPYTQIWIGVGADVASFSLDALYTYTENVVSIGDDGSFWDLSARYQIPSFDGLTMGIDYSRLDAGPVDWILTGVGAEYRFDNGFGLSGSYFRQEVGGLAVDGAIIEASFRF